MNRIRYMARKVESYFRKKCGQALAEFSVIALVMVILAFGIMEFGRMISLSVRMASVCREVGRTFYANEYDTNTIDDIFTVATNMIAPGNLQSNGKMIVTIVERVSGNSTFLTDTNNSNDVLVITNRFFYPYTGNPSVAASNSPAWPTRLPTTYSSVVGADTKLIPFTNNVGPVSLNMLQLNGKTAVVEVFHTNSTVAPINNLGVNVQPYLYDISAF